MGDMGMADKIKIKVIVPNDVAIKKQKDSSKISSFIKA